MKLKYALRPVVAADEAFLIRLYGESRSDAALLATWPAEQREALLLSQFELQRSHYVTSFPAAVHQIITLDGRPVGRLWMDWREGEARCLDLAVLPEYRSKGLGGRILEDLKAEAIVRQVPLTLHVEHLNLAALRFYEQHGFGVIGDIGTHCLLEWKPPA